jgi:cytochrome c oxidase cbb3-type subunit 1
MNGSTSSSVSTTPATPTSACIDSSARILLLPIISALIWLVVSSVLALIASVKLHSPTVLADCAWLSYGHARPAANDAFVYGFASQAGLAVALWILCRLGRNTLVGAIPVGIASIFWNLGVTLGVLGIFTGHTTGFDWLEFPKAGSAILLASYFVLGVVALLNFRARQTAETYPSQWYILAALFWFPWLYTTARLLLVWFPVRGVTQLAVSGWFTNGLFTLWLTSLGLAVLLYFIPKISQAPLFNRGLALIAFWGLALFGGFAGFYRGQPLPAWMISVGMVATVVLLVPMVATVANLWITMGQGTPSKSGLLGYFKFSLIGFALCSVFAVFNAFVPQLRLTLFGEGVEQLFLYGFIGLALFGAIQYLAPLLTGQENNKFVCANGMAVTFGILIFAAAFIIGGILQQKHLVDGSVPFLALMLKTKMFIRISTLGLLVLVIGNLLLLVRVLLLVRACCKSYCAECCPESKSSVKLKPAGAAR